MNRGHRLLTVSAASLILLISFVLFLSVDAVTVRLPRLEDSLFDAVRVTEGDEMQLRYRHSVEKTLVEGIFTIGPGPALRARETRMTSVGTGLPNTRVDKTRREGQWLVVDEGLTRIPGFDFFIASVNATRLVVNGTAVAVETLASGSVVRIDVERIRLLEWLLWRYGNKDWGKDRNNGQG